MAGGSHWKQSLSFVHSKSQNQLGDSAADICACGEEIYLINSKYLKIYSYGQSPIRSDSPLPTQSPSSPELCVCICHQRGIVNLQVTVTSQTYLIHE